MYCILFTWENNVRGSDNRKSKWKKIIMKKAKMSHKLDLMIKQPLAIFKNSGKAIFGGFVMLFYVNNVHSILFTRKSIW